MVGIVKRNLMMSRKGTNYENETDETTVSIKRVNE
jgi:hypothetical protein